MSLAVALRSCVNLSDEERARHGAQGRALVRARFTWETVAAQSLMVYRWLVDDGPAPDTVFNG